MPPGAERPCRPGRRGGRVGERSQGLRFMSRWLTSIRSAPKVQKVHFFAKMGPSGAGAPKPKYVGSFLGSAEAHFAKKYTFSQKVHFSAISAPGRRQKHRRLSLYLESAQKVRKKRLAPSLLRKVRFRHLRIGKTRVHVVKLQNGDFCDDFCEIFPFRKYAFPKPAFL